MSDALLHAAGRSRFSIVASVVCLLAGCGSPKPGGPFPVDTLPALRLGESGTPHIVLPPPVPCPDTPVLPASVHGDTVPGERRSFLIRNGYCTYFVPEYHDEQRLTDGTASDYGSIAYSYAHQFPIPGPLETHTGYDKGWINVAAVYVDGPHLFPAYNALRLRPGPNCVYLRHIHPNNSQDDSERWAGRIIPPDNNGLCSGGNGGSVPVQAERPFDDPAAYPPVTRWMEGHGKRMILGVRCGDQWCLIGPGSAAFTATHAGHPDAGSSPQWIVRGWHDEQALGVPATGGRFNIRQLAPRLSIVPDDSLGMRSAASFQNVWIQVATIIVRDTSGLPAKYAAIPGYGFALGKNVISIRNSTQRGWQGRVTNQRFPANGPNGGHIYERPVMWTDHSMYVSFVPATARWRWRDLDEEIWTRCGIGCCMVQPQ